ncbi:hypothetical protein ACIP96_06310 [Streptomyces nigra]|uniref:hypothetical protein n=1 Tax=Streptomyces nigra TaxID=1827580 RepID=UPI0037FCF1F3
MSILDELLVRLGIDSDGLGADSAAAADQVENNLSGIAAGAAGLAVGGLFVMGLESAMDITEATTQLQNQLGLTSEQAQEAGQIAGDVYAQGFGDSVTGVAESLAAVSQNMGGFAELGKGELTELTRQAEALAKTFQFDVAESTQAAGELIKAGLAKNGQEAFDLITSAAKQLPPALREEIPALTREYSQFFDQLGFTGPQMMGLLAESAKSPVFEIDKVGDTLKELTLRLAETDAVRDPLKELGLDVEDIQKKINTGKGTQALDDITTALAGVENQTDRTRLAAALMGGPGEDAQAVLKALGDAGGITGLALKDTAGSAKDVADTLAASPGQAWDSIMRTLATTVGEALAPALGILAGFLADNPGLVQAVVPVVLALAVALGIWAAAQWAVNSALLANPVTWIILGIVALVAGIVMIATKTTWFQTIWSAMTTAVVAAWDWLWGLVKSTVSTVLSWVTSFMSAQVNLALSIFGWFASLPGRIGAWFGSVRQAAVDKLVSLLTWIRSLPGRIKSSLGDLGSLLLEAGKSIIRGLINGVVSMIGNLKNKFSQITDMIPDWKGPMQVDLQLLAPSGQALMTGLMSGIDAEVPALERQLTGITNTIPGNVNAGVGTAAAAGGRDELVVRWVGSQDDFTVFMRKSVDFLGGGSVQKAYGSGEG